MGVCYGIITIKDYGHLVPGQGYSGVVQKILSSNGNWHFTESGLGEDTTEKFLLVDRALFHPSRTSYVESFGGIYSGHQIPNLK